MSLAEPIHYLCIFTNQPDCRQGRDGSSGVRGNQPHAPVYGVTPGYFAPALTSIRRISGVKVFGTLPKPG